MISIVIICIIIFTYFVYKAHYYHRLKIYRNDLYNKLQTYVNVLRALYYQPDLYQRYNIVVNYKNARENLGPEVINILDFVIDILQLPPNERRAGSKNWHLMRKKIVMLSNCFGNHNSLLKFMDKLEFERDHISFMGNYNNVELDNAIRNIIYTSYI